jgi:hypothetical protein
VVSHREGGRNPTQKLQSLCAAAGKNARFLKGRVLLVKVACGDNGLRTLVEDCNGVGRVILKERDSQDVAEDKRDGSIELAGFARV